MPRLLFGLAERVAEEVLRPVRHAPEGVDLEPIELGAAASAVDEVEGALVRPDGFGGHQRLQTAEDVNALVWELQTTARTATSVAREVEAMVKENRQPIRDFASTGLYELSTFLSELRLLVAGLNRVTTEVGRDPARFLFGRQQDGYEAR